MAANLSLDELPAEARAKALAAMGRKRAPRQQTFTKDKARTHAIRVLAVVADLSPADRGRVLKLALAMNAV